MKGKILIADDEPRIRKIMTLLLSQEGYEVKSVENGKADSPHAPCPR